AQSVAVRMDRRVVQDTRPGRSDRLRTACRAVQRHFRRRHRPPHISSEPGVNCLELMPVTSPKLDFDWDYGPLHYFSPSAHFGGPDGLRRLVDACHHSGIAVILDVVYQHVDPAFAYKLVYDNVNNTPGPPNANSPMIGANGPFGPQCDFGQVFTQQ